MADNGELTVYAFFHGDIKFTGIWEREERIPFTFSGLRWLKYYRIATFGLEPVPLLQNMSHKVPKLNWFSWHLIQSFLFWKLIKTNKQTNKQANKKIKINKGVKFLKKLWCSVGGWLQQGNLESSTELKCKLATAKSFKASVSSVYPSSEGMKTKI